MKRYGLCEKCMTPWSELYEVGGRWLCKSNACYYEETENREADVERNEAQLDEYRKLVAGTKNTAPSGYPE